MSLGQGVLGKKQVTAIALMDTREIGDGLINVQDDGGFDGLMVAAKRYKPTDQPQYHHFVNENVLEVLTIDVAGVSGSGTPTLTITVNTQGFSRRGDKFLLNNGKVGMINSAVTNAGGKDSFTLTSVDGTNLTAVAGDRLSPNGLVVGEKSLEVSVLTYGQTKYFNQIEVLADKIAMTDIQMKSKVEIGDKYYAYTQSIAQARSFKIKLSTSLWSGVKSVNTFGTASPTLLDKDGNSVQTTGGVYNEVTTYGITGAVATPGIVVSADIDALLDSLLAVKAPSEYMLISPDKSWRKYDDYFKNLNSSGITSAKLMVDGNELDLNITKFQKGKFTLDYTPMGLLDHPEVYNYVGNGLVGKSIVGVAKDKIKVEGGQGSSYEPRVGVRYMPNPKASLNQGTEYVQEFETGGLAKYPTSSEQVLNVHWLSRQGAEVQGAKVLFAQRVTA